MFQLLRMLWKLVAAATLVVLPLQQVRSFRVAKNSYETRLTLDAEAVNNTRDGVRRVCPSASDVRLTIKARLDKCKTDEKCRFTQLWNTYHPQSKNPKAYLDMLKNFAGLEEVSVGGGRSKACMYRTKSQSFFVKTIDRAEGNKLSSIFTHYVKHFQEHPHSLLARFYDLFRIREYSVVIMDNLRVSTIDAPLSLVFDLKGSHWKHTLDRPAQRRDEQFTKTLDAEFQKDQFQSSSPLVVDGEDLDFIDIRLGSEGHTELKRKLAQVFNGQRKVHNHFNDSGVDENAKLRMAPCTWALLRQQLFADTTWLTKYSLMDYSVLLQIVYYPEAELKSKCPPAMHPSGLTWCLGGIRAESESAVYYFTIIDYLTTWSSSLKGSSKLVQELFGRNAGCWENVYSFDTSKPRSYSRRVRDFIGFWIRPEIEHEFPMSELASCKQLEKANRFKRGKPLGEFPVTDMKLRCSVTPGYKATAHHPTVDVAVQNKMDGLVCSADGLQYCADWKHHKITIHKFPSGIV